MAFAPEAPQQMRPLPGFAGRSRPADRSSMPGPRGRLQASGRVQMRSHRSSSPSADKILAPIDDEDKRSVLRRPELQRIDQPLVLVVRSDPEPHDLIAVSNSNGTIVEGNSSREHGNFLVNTFEMEARMRRIQGEESIGIARALANLAGQLPICFPELSIRV